MSQLHRKIAGSGLSSNIKKKPRVLGRGDPMGVFVGYYGGNENQKASKATLTRGMMPVLYTRGGHRRPAKCHQQEASPAGTHSTRHRACRLKNREFDEQMKYQTNCLGTTRTKKASSRRYAFR